MSDAPVITREQDGDVAVLVFDVPGERMNTLSEATFADLERLLGTLADDAGTVGAVLISGKADSFCAGADIRRLPELAALAARGQADEALAYGHRVIRELREFSKPLVAAVHGVALGGGLELAMACHERIATNDARTQLGLPEVKLGLLPGAGGTQHLPRLVPVPVALEHLLTGKSMYPRKARELGLVDDVVPANQLRRVAVTHVRALAAGEHAPRAPHPLPDAAALDDLVAGARWLADERTKGLWPAPGRIIDVVETGLREGIEAGLAAEREAFAELLTTPQAGAGIHLFLASEAAKKRSTAGARAVRKIFVLGGGMMGSGLGATAIDHGFDTRVRDLSGDALSGVRRYADKVLHAQYEKRGAAFPYLYRDRIHRLSTTTDLSGIRTADLVIEAVFEDLELKHRVLREAEAAMRPDAVLASNTSAIPITLLAQSTSRPEQLIGMHFFSPVEKMPLVELITHPGTSEETVATALAVTLALGKVPIVVADSPGFYTSRVFARWAAEGTRLLLEGATIEQIDAGAKAIGFPVGPMTAYDEVSLELAHKAGADPTTAAVTADRLDPAPARAAIEALVASGHRGRKAGLGFYRYDADDKRVGVAEDVYRIVGAPGTGMVDDDDIRDRLLYAFVTEALLCYDEGLLRSPDDGDVGAVFGIGFPPNLGGPFHYVDQIGAKEALAVIEALDTPEPGAFTASRGLRERAESGGTFGSGSR